VIAADVAYVEEDANTMLRWHQPHLDVPRAHQMLADQLVLYRERKFHSTMSKSMSRLLERVDAAVWTRMAADASIMGEAGSDFLDLLKRVA
jgi:hypothetical protein